MPTGHQTDHEFARVLRAAIADSDLTLRDIRQRLAERGTSVSLSSLSTWQSGASRPERHASLVVIEQLEAVLDLDAGRLRDALGPRSARTRPPRDEPLLGADCWPMPHRITQLLGALGAAPFDPREPQRISHRMVQHIGADTLPVRMDHTLVVVAGAEGADEFFKVTRYPPWSHPPRITDTHGLRLCGFRGDPATGHAAFAMRLDPPLGPHEGAQLEFSEHEPPGSEERMFDVRVQPGLQSLVLEARFRADALPREVSASYRSTLRSPVRHLERWHGGRVPSGRFRLVRVRPEPGIYGISWR